MANRQQNGNREKKKPKATKAKVPPQVSTFSRPAIANGAKDPSKKG